MSDSTCNAQLKELDINRISFDKTIATSKIVNDSQKSTFLTLLDDLKEGESCQLRKMEPLLECVNLEIDWWHFRSLVGGAEHLSDYVCVTRKHGGTVSVLCSFQANTLKRLISKDWVKLKLKRLTCATEIEMVSAHRLSDNKQFLTVFNTSFEVLFEDLQRNISLLSTECHLPVLTRFTASVLPPAVLIASSSNSSSLSQIPQEKESQNIASYEIPLRKSQVTYLIGKGGTRIESIRDQSKATIKILPISKKLTTYELSRPDSVLQAITITGDWLSVALAMAYIESHLNLHKIFPTDQF